MANSAITDQHAEDAENAQPHSEETEHVAMGRATKHTVGLFLLALVIFMWTACNFLGSSIFADGTYAKPFFLTYLNSSVFSLLLLPQLVKSMYRETREGTFRSSVRSLFSRDTVRQFVFNSRKSHHVLDHAPTSETSLLGNDDGEELSPVDIPAHVWPESRNETDNDDEYLDHVSTARLSLIFCSLWFGANYCSLSALQFTAVASATILTSTASMWTLVIGAITGIESFTWKKLCGVLASFFGIVLISMLDVNSAPSTDNSPSLIVRLLQERPSLYARALNEFPDKPASELILGDAMALMSAIVYGFYTITLKKNTLRAHPRTLHMPTFFGFVGLFNAIILLPLFPILHFTGAEPFSWPPSRHVWTVLFSHTLSSLLSDMCWAYALAFTSPLVTTVGLSLTIPVSLIGEMVLQGRYNGWVYWLGAMIVVGGFVFVDREEVREEQERGQGWDEAVPASAIVSDGHTLTKGSSSGASPDFGAEERGHIPGRAEYGSIDEGTQPSIDTASDIKGKSKSKR